MEQTGKRYSLIVPLAVFLAAVAVLVRIGPVVSVTASAAAISDRTVVIDAGHGGADGGTVGRSGTLEKDLNLKIALKTAEFLRFFGANVVLTRTDDRSLHTNDAASLREQKNEDLRVRCAIVSAAENPLYVAIHQNYFADTVSHGAQLFYASGSPDSKQLAEALQARLHELLPQSGERSAAELPHKNYILGHLTCPAVILECGFLSHPEEEMRLCSPEYQAALAFCVTSAVLENLSSAANATLDG